MSNVVINRPPRDIAPADFFESWLPAEYERLRSLDSDMPAPPDVTANITVEGDGGGCWSLAIADQKLTVTTGASDDPLVGFALSLEDWREVVASEGGEDDLVPGNTSGIDVILAGSTAQDTLKDTRGTIRFEVTGFKGRTWAAEVAFGGAAEPRATIGVDFDTYKQVRNGTLPAPQAYFSGKLVIGGDTNLAMQVGMSLMAKMS